MTLRMPCRMPTAAIAVTLLAGSALAEIPAALDRVPTDAAVVASIANIQELKDNLEGLQKIIPGMEMDLGEAEQILGADGLNRNGSVAMVLLSAENGLNFDGDSPMVMVVPVTDFRSLIAGFNGDSSGPISQFDAGGDTLFARDLGGGFAVMSPHQDLVTSFKGEGGNMGAHKARIGSSGSRIGDNADAFVIADIKALEPMMREGIKEMKRNMEMMAQMAGPQGDQMKASAEMIEQVADAFMRDADVGIMGLDFTRAGISLDFGAQFKEGSESAAFFQSSGKASALLGRVPAEKYLFALGMDTRAEGLRKLMKQANDMAMAMNPGAADAGAMNPTWFLDKSNGMSLVMGEPPSIFGGALSKLSYFIASDDPAGITAAYKESHAQMNGQTVQGVSFDTSYTPESAEINGVKVDSWSMKMKVDPNVPGAMQQQQAFMMFFGPQMGPSGYAAEVKNGVIYTMSQDAPLMTKALEAAGSGNGLGADTGIQSVTENLHDGSTFVMYVGVGNIIDMVANFAAMMGQQIPFQAPDDLKPIGIGATTDGGGLGARVFFPMDVIKTFGEIAETAQGGMQGGKPRF